MSLEAVALTYLNKGLSVIPVGKDKKPLIPWKDYQTKLATEEDIMWWWVTYPEAQIGIVTGKISNLVVVDVDDPKADTSWLTPTLTAQTGSGGFHFYYRYSKEYTNKARIKEMVDIRAEGGYVVAPPSENLKGKYTWINKLSIVDFPEQLFPKSESIKPTYKAEEFEGYGEGQRNQSMAEHIGHIIARVHPLEWENIAWPKILNDNQKNRPPLDEQELRTIFESITNAERRRNSDRWYKQQEALKEEFVEDSEDDEVLPLAQVAERQSDKNQVRFSSGFPAIDEITMGGFKDGDLVVISAQSGHGKTSLAQTFTYHFLKQNQPCLWFSYEVLVGEIYRKFKEMGLTADDLAFSPLKMTTGNLEWVEKKIKEAKQKFNTKFVFIDHLGFLMPKITGGIDKIEKSYPLFLTQIMRQLKTLAKEQNVVIILPVHTKKTDNPEMNDIAYSAGISQESDFVFMMNREKMNDDEDGEFYSPYTRLTLQKNRPTGITSKLWIKMEQGRFIIDPVYQPIKKTKHLIKK